MKCLFIGGPADGQRIEVPDNTQCWLLRVPYQQKCADFEKLSPFQACKDVTYVAQFFTAQGREWRVFVPDRMPAADALQCLMDRYPRPR